MSRPVVPRLELIAAAVLFSTGGAAVKASAFAPVQVAGFRSGIAALAVLALAPAARRGWTPGALLVGVTYAATLVLFVLANRMTTAANTIFLQSTAPLYILVLGPLLLGERIRRRDLGFMLAVALGLALFFVGVDPPARTAPDPFRGNLLAAASGLTWALTVIGLRWLGSAEGRGSAVASVVAGNVTAFLVCLPWALPVGAHGAGDWGVLLYLGVFQIAVAYIFVTRALRSIPAFEASILLLVEPVLNPVWAWLLHGERPGAWALVGGAVILAATMVKSWRESRMLEPAT